MKQNHTKYLNLRKEFPFFEYQSYSFQVNKQVLEAEFVFNISGIYTFRPTIKVDGRDFYKWKNLSKSDIDNLVFHIGMIELISYWKTTCTPLVIISANKLDSKQIDWWKKLYFHGLGEFFYLNGIETDMNDFMQIRTEGEVLKMIACSLSNSQVIIPVGGGKDSVVTLEVLKESDLGITPMTLNPRDAIIRTINAAGFDMDESIVVERKLDPKLIKLNEKGYLNGHTPFSALLAFVNVLTAVGSSTKYIALSNENSANQSTIPGTMINHQYSKSYEFEADFNWYVKNYMHSELKYFSFLRPLNELQIAKLFSEYIWHHDSFRSCNVGSKTDSWCGKCPKCLFTDIMLAPFLTEKQRFEIFHKNLLNDENLESIFDELTGKASIKPFECVGTPDEVRAALFAYAKKLDSEEYPVLLNKFMEDYSDANLLDDFSLLLKQYNGEHFIDASLEKYLQAKIPFQKEGFKAFLQNELVEYPQALILGYGKEGRSTYALLRKYFPEKQIGIADRNKAIAEIPSLQDDKYLKLFIGEDYLGAIYQYGLIIKSPGIKLNPDKIRSNTRITSQTELFLSYYRDQVIGVTGTKGKSTTVSLIHHFLQSTGKKSVLLGNIGTPAFDLIHNIDDDTIIVFELSAHQLQNIHVSPHIAVLLNIFPEHLDHFDEYVHYEEAKLNIARYQMTGDKLIISDLVKKQTEGFDAERSIITFNERKRNYVLSDNLKGDHNLFNIEVALSAIQAAGVDKSIAKKSINEFKALPHRMEFVGIYGGISFYNDSISTISESTIAAVKTISKIGTLILGGFDRGLDYCKMVSFLQKSSIKNFIFLGIAGEKMMAIFKEVPNPGQQLFQVDSLTAAFKIVEKHTPTNSACLLSPAAASYDQFHNFEHRGDKFKELAKSMTIK